MSEHNVIISGATSAPELPASHPPTPKFLALAMTSRQNEQGDRIAAVDRRFDGQDARFAGLESRLSACADAAAAAAKAAEQAVQLAKREPPDCWRTDAALATSGVALLIVALYAVGVF